MFDSTIYLLATEKTGGLFDLDGTLPLVVVQFLFLMVLLDKVLYEPLLKALQERDTYVRTNIQTAGNKIAESENLTARYKKRQIKFTKVAETHSLFWQKRLKNIINTLAQKDQTALNELSAEAEENLDLMRNISLLAMQDEINLLSNEIVEKILA